MGDGVVVTAQLAYQYIVQSTRIHELTLNYQDYEGWTRVLSLKAQSGIRNACSKFLVQEFQTRRSAVQTQMLDDVIARLASPSPGMGANVLDLQLTQVDRPASYEL